MALKRGQVIWQLFSISDQDHNVHMGKQYIKFIVRIFSIYNLKHLSKSIDMMYIIYGKKTYETFQESCERFLPHPQCKPAIHPLPPAVFWLGSPRLQEHGIQIGLRQFHGLQQVSVIQWGAPQTRNGWSMCFFHVQNTGETYWDRYIWIGEMRVRVKKTHTVLSNQRQSNTGTLHESGEKSYLIYVNLEWQETQGPVFNSPGMSRH